MPPSHNIDMLIVQGIAEKNFHGVASRLMFREWNFDLVKDIQRSEPLAIKAIALEGHGATT